MGYYFFEAAFIWSETQILYDLKSFEKKVYGVKFDPGRLDYQESAMLFLQTPPT